MKKKNEAREMIISIRRVIDVCLQYWWIVAVTTLVMLAVVLCVGRTETGPNTDAKSYVLIAIQAEDLVEEQYLENFLLDGRNELTTSREVVKDVLALVTTDSTMEHVREEMERQGFEDCNPADAAIENIESTRIIEIAATGADAGQNVALVNTVADELVNITSEQLGLPGARVLQRAELEEGTEAEIGSTYVTRKNLALIALGIMLGCVCLGVLIIIDNRIRSREEVDWCYEGTYIGTIRGKYAKEAADRIVQGIYGLLGDHAEKVAVVSFRGNEKWGELLRQNDSKEKLEFVPEILRTSEGLERVRKAGHVVLSLGINRDKFDDLDELVYTLNNMGVAIVGYILTK